MGICCSKAKAPAGDLDDGEQGFPWMHDDLFHHHLWTSAAVSMHTKQGWKGANQDAMTVSQVNTHDFSLPPRGPSELSLGLLVSTSRFGVTQAATRHGAATVTMPTLICLPTATCIHNSSPLFFPHTVASATLFSCLTIMHLWIHLDLRQPEMHLMFQPPVFLGVVASFSTQYFTKIYCLMKYVGRGANKK
jgi:hypothetical protein